MEVTRVKRNSKSGTVASAANQCSDSEAKAGGKAGLAMETISEAASGAGQEQETDLFDQARARTAGRVEASLDATQLYLNEIGYSPLLTADEEKNFSRHALKGDDSASRLSTLYSIVRSFAAPKR